MSINSNYLGSKKMKTSIVWFRKSIRIHDNPVLEWASSSEDIDSIIPIYIMEDKWNLDEGSIQGRSRLNFLYESLLDLDRNLKENYGAKLLVFSGDPVEIIESIINSLDGKINWLFCDYCSEPRSRDEINKIEKNLTNLGIHSKVFQTVNTILDIEKITQSNNFINPKSSKDIDRIFKKNLNISPDGYLVDEAIPIPHNICTDSLVLETVIQDTQASQYYVPCEEIRQKSEQLILKSERNSPYFPGGEREALKRLKKKVSERPDFVNNFKKPKTFSTNEEGNPMEPTTTGLSPYISHGCLSVRLVWNECAKANFNSNHTKPPESLHGQLMFREMFYLLSRSVENWEDDINNSNCKPINWGEYDQSKIIAWESGMTGFPYIDAMMRQLDATGWMHHLGRHAVSCFLTRGQLWQNWKHGRDVFERKLVDSDWAINNGNWLWLAGVAPFSMPYYRVYNPCPDSKSSLNVEAIEANFVRFWVPELASYPSKYIFEPHLAPLEVQRLSKCIIGQDYPLPIIDRKVSRSENLSMFKENVESLKRM